MEKEIKLIATHDGKFHADEIFAIAIIRKLYPEAKVIRTRNPEEWKQADIRIDVGGVHNPETYDFDHHQKEFTKKRESGVGYSSCGIIWDSYGRKIVTSEEEFKQLEENMIEFIDAQDTGFDYSNGKLKIHTLKQVIDGFNPQWNEDIDRMEQFNKAIAHATIILDNELRKVKAYKEGIDIVSKALKENANEGFIILPQTGLPIGELIRKEGLFYSVSQGIDGNWGVLALPKKAGTFENKKDLPQEWGGLEGKELQTISGVQDAVFCHKNLFLCVAKSKEGAIALAQKALKN